ncbi:MAG: GNAT family protein [Gudongella sp.]|jgi:RimJ/RimL family protein N-acetyltransferase|nr:GNAT family protein [Gudongella sp.]
MKVYLRALELNDYILINEWRKDPEITKYLAGNVFFVSSEREKKSIENKIFDDSVNVYLGICEKQSDKLIGYTSINNIDLRNSKAEWASIFIGDKNVVGQGYGKEASILTLRFLFDQYPIHKCYGRCLEEHPKTVKLLLSLGFTQDGILRDDVFKNGEFKNVLLFSLLREEINGQF